MKASALMFALAAPAISMAAAAATPDAQVMAPIHLFVDSFNRGDLKMAATAVSPAGMAVVDDVPPHVWTGPTALEAWMTALGASDQAEGNTDGAVEIGKPSREVISADRAYVVMPAVYTFKRKGSPMREAGHMVCALQKGASGWQLTALTWVGATKKPVAAGK